MGGCIMWIGSVLKDSIATLEDSLSVAIREADTTMNSIEQDKKKLKNISERIEGYRQALKILREESNKI